MTDWILIITLIIAPSRVPVTEVVSFHTKETCEAARKDYLKAASNISIRDEHVHENTIAVCAKR